MGLCPALASLRRGQQRNPVHLLWLWGATLAVMCAYNGTEPEKRRESRRVPLSRCWSSPTGHASHVRTPLQRSVPPLRSVLPSASDVQAMDEWAKLRAATIPPSRFRLLLF